MQDLPDFSIIDTASFNNFDWKSQIVFSPEFTNEIKYWKSPVVKNNIITLLSIQ